MLKVQSNEWHQSVAVSLQPCTRHPFNASFTLSQKETRHVLVNHKGDAAGGGDANHVGDDAFVETSGAFIPARKENDSEWTLLVMLGLCSHWDQYHTSMSIWWHQERHCIYCAGLAGELAPPDTGKLWPQQISLTVLPLWYIPVRSVHTENQMEWEWGGEKWPRQ